MVCSIGGCVLSLSSSLQMLFEYYTIKCCQGNVLTFYVTNNFGIHKFALYAHMLLMFDIGVSKGEMISYQEVCILCVQHVMKYVWAMNLSFMFVFYGIDYLCFRILCVMLFYFMDYNAVWIKPSSIGGI